MCEGNSGTYVNKIAQGRTRGKRRKGRKESRLERKSGRKVRRKETLKRKHRVERATRW